MTETNYLSVDMDALLSGDTHTLSVDMDALLAKTGQTLTVDLDAKLVKTLSVDMDALIVDPQGTFRGTLTTAERDALPALQAQDTVLNMDATTAPSGVNVTQAQFWTGSAWLSGNTMQSPVSGVTSLFVVPTTAGWRIEEGDPATPFKFWDGTDINFSFDNAGTIFARGVNVRPKSSDQYGFNITRSSITGDALTMQKVGDAEYRYYQEVSGDMYWGTGALTQDVSLFRVSKTGGGGYLRVSTGLLWGDPAAASRLEDDYSIRLGQTSKPTNVSNAVMLYAKDISGTAKLFWEDDGGTEYDLSAVGGTDLHLSNDTLWDALGDTVYASAADTGAKLAGNTTTTKKVLSQTGNGSVSAAPAWAQVAYADVSGTPTITTLANDTLWAATGDLVYATGNDAAAVLTANSTATNKYLRSVSSGAPSWQQVPYTDISGTPTFVTYAKWSLE